jgi:hypothetical protein
MTNPWKMVGHSFDLISVKTRSYNLINRVLKAKGGLKMINPTNVLIELLLYAINVFIILKSTGKTKALGIALLLSRLTFLLYLLPIFSQWIYLFPMISYLTGSLGVIALIIFLKKKSLIARNYAILTIGYMLFRHIVFWGGFILLIFNFFNDRRNPKKLEVENKKS